MATTRPPATYADLAHENMHLLAALWRLAWTTGPRGFEHFCLICDRCGPDKATIRHQPGCALFGQDPALLAQMDEFDRMPEAV